MRPTVKLRPITERILRTTTPELSMTNPPPQGSSHNAEGSPDGAYSPTADEGQSKPSGNKGKWIAGIVAGVVLLAVIAVGGLFAAGVLDTDDDKPGKPVAEGSTNPPSSNGTNGGPTPSEPTVRPTAYKFVDNLCGKLDFSELAKLVTFVEPPKAGTSYPREGSSGRVTCAATMEGESGGGLLSFQIGVAPTEGQSQDAYRGYLTAYQDKGEKKAAPKQWAQGTVITGSNEGDASVVAIVQDKNLCTSLTVAMSTKTLTNEQIEPLVLDLLRQVSRLTAA